MAAAAGVGFRGEDFDVRAFPEGEVLGVLDRGALPAFGVMGVGVHLNGLVRRADGWWLWVARRAADKKLDPGKLDHLVAGGVSAGLTPWETLVKEAAEEAGLSAELVGQAREVGRFGYALERAEGLRRDFLYAYDLVLPEGFVPVAADGEVAGFELWPLGRVFETVAAGEAFKFNVNLVLVDLFIRYGLVSGQDAAVLRRALTGDFA
jgi:8-oxo-dGTP pyrophosphatase MutT (NUDIX family)